MLLELCKQTSLRILNGPYCNDKDGKYTFIWLNGHSHVDCVISLQNLMPKMCACKVRDPNILSDHCLVVLIKIETCTTKYTTMEW